MTSTLNHLADRAGRLIEQSSALDPVSDVLARFWGAVLPAGPVRNAFGGTPLGHPLHPALVAVPIGSWASAAVLDVVAGRSGRAAATALIATGNLSAIPTVAAGASDWLYTSGERRRVGAVHAVTNAVAVSLFTASWVARRTGRHRLGVGLSSTGLALTGFAGWLGGHLAYSRGVGVDTTTFERLPEDWTDVGREEEVREGRGLLVRAHGLPVLLARDGGSLIALADRCTHRGGPLHEGKVEDGCVTCPWHASRFRLTDGRVESGPATRPQPRLEVRVVEGRVEVRAPADAFNSDAVS